MPTAPRPESIVDVVGPADGRAVDEVVFFRGSGGGSGVTVYRPDPTAAAEPAPAIEAPAER